MNNTVSVSKVSCYNTCPYKYHLTYNEGLRKRSGDVSALSLGDAVHKGIAAGLKVHYEYQDGGLYSHQHVLDAAEMAVREWAVKNINLDKTAPTLLDDGSFEYIPDESYHIDFNELVETAVALACRTLDSLNLRDNYRVINDDELVPLIEYKLELKVPGTRFNFVGYVDAVLENKSTGLIEVFDWKTRRIFVDSSQQELDMQLALYQHALRSMGVDAKVAVIYQIKPLLPAIPKQNKDGSISRAKITTDWDTYSSFVRGSGLDDNDYVDMKDKLSDVEFFKPLRFVRLAKVTEYYWNNFVTQVCQLKKVKVFPQVLGYPCRHCQFKSWCYALAHGHDLNSLLLTEYEHTPITIAGVTENDA